MILAISAVSAADMDDTSDSAIQSIGETAVDDVVSTGAVEDIQTATNDADVLAADGDGNFTELQTSVNTGMVMMSKDYTRVEGENDISISRDVTILGNNHKIDANNLGGIFNVNSGYTLTLIGVTLINGNAENGGAVYNNGGTLTITNSYFINNTATQSGGAIYNNGGTLNVIGSTFDGNDLTDRSVNGWGGAAIYDNAGTVLISTSTITNNLKDIVHRGGTGQYTGDLSSAAVTSQSGTLTVSDSYFGKNSGSYGGAILSQGDDAVLSVVGSTFEDNFAFNGGAINIVSSKYTISNSTFRGNNAKGTGSSTSNYANGGAICAQENDNDDGLISDCIFEDNTAAIGGAITTQIAQVTGCTFTNNTALASNSEKYNGKTHNKGGFGGAIFNDNTIIIEDSTFTDNTGRGRGLDLKNADISGSSFTNTIINVNNHGTVSVSDNLYDNDGKDISSNTGCTVTVTVGNGEVPLVTSGTIIFEGDLTFQDLQDIVDAGNTAITLNGNVLKSDEEEQTFANGIIISHYVSIYAQGHTITANNGKVFTVNQGNTLVLFNANVVGDGTSAIVNNGKVSLMVASPSTFTNVGEFAIDNQGTLYQDSMTTFTQLSDLIALVNGGKIDIYTSKITKADDEKATFADGIVVEKDLTITGYANSKGVISTYLDAANSGRIFSVNDGATLTLNKIILKNGNAEKGGAVYVEAANGFIAQTVDFINNTAVYRGGAIYSEGTVNVADCVFDSNDITFRSANDNNGGAAIYNLKGTLTILDSSITNNIKDIVIRDGNNGDLLDGVVATYGPTTIRGSYFANNTGSWGGAITALSEDDGFAVLIEDTIFEGNNATFGGAIFADSVILEVNNCTFENNKGVGVGSPGTSYTQGGAIMIQGADSALTMTDSTFIANSADIGGAVSLPNVGADSIIDNCTFKDNTARADGGALYFWTTGADVTVTDSEFVNNAAPYGGAIENEGTGDLTVENCIFTENTASARGGAIISSGSTSVSDSVFTDNEALGNTNAIYLWNTNTTLALSNNVITGSDDVQIYVKDGINITTPLKVRILDNDTYDINMSPYNITAIVTDANDNQIFDYAFRFVVGDAVVEGININTNTGVYSALFTPTEIGTFIVSTNLEDDSAVETATLNVFRTLSDLAKLIQDTEEDGTLVLASDYTYVPEFDSDLVNGIVINKNIVIDGNGSTISGSNVARLFSVAADVDFTLRNATLRDAKADKGGAVYVENNALFEAFYVDFINNTAVYKGGAIYSEGVASAVGCVFDSNDITFRTSNDDNGGAAVYNHNGRLAIAFSNITNNLKDIVIRNGNDGDLLVGVVATSGETLITDCYFANNTGSWGAAISSLGYLNSDEYTLTVMDSRFEGNNATFGGAIFVESSKLEVDGSTFENNKGVGVGSSGTSNTQGGAIVVFSDGSSAQITDSTFIGNSARTGGAVSLSGVDSDSLIGNCTFTDNSGNDGGAVYIWTTGDAAVTVKDSRFSGNTAGWGNAISTDGTLKLSNNTISTTSADIGNWGGSIVSTIKVVILNNETVDASGETLITATVTDDNGNLIKDVNFDFVIGETIVHAAFNQTTGLYEGIYNNTAGGVYTVNISYPNEENLVVETATLRNIKGTFTELQNIIDNDETGSIDLPSDFQYDETIDGDKFVNGIVIDKNIIIDGNGSIISGSNLARIFNVAANSELNLINVTLRDAKADKGGAVYVENGASFDAHDVDFINNTAVYKGGAIYSEGDVNVVDCVFDSNDITFRTSNDDNGGAAIYNYNGALTIEHSNITNNLKDIVIRNGNDGDLLVGVVATSGETIISDSYFANNTGSWGAAISSLGYLNSDEYTVTVMDSRFEGNNATFGGAIFVESSKLEVDNCIFENNKGVGVGSSGTSNTQGGAIVVFSEGSSAKITDSTFIGNSARTGGAVSLSGVDSDSLIGNCTFTDNSGNDGGAVYIWTTGDAAVTVKDSRFSGNTAGWGNAISTDGTLKLSNNTISTTSADIGNWNGVIISTLYIEIMDNGTYSYHMSDIVLNATITDDNGNLIRDINFNFLIGETDEVSATLNGDIYTGVYTPTAPGTYAVNITYENMDNLVIKTATITISKSLIDLANIISNADEGDTIVLDGDYAYIEEFDSSIINGIVIDKNIVIDGKGATISGSNVARLFNVTSGAKFTLSNVTLRDAKADKGGAVYVDDNALFDAYNVNFINNTAVYKGGAIYSEGVTVVVGCVFDSNDITFRAANDDNGGAAIFNYNGGLSIIASNITNNLKDIVIRNGNDGDLLVGVVATSGETLITNSYFANNTGSWGGAISSLGYLNSEAYTVTVTDSRFEGNNATFGGAIFVESSKLDVDNCTFENNKGVGVGSTGTSNTQGGAIIIQGANSALKMTDSTFIANSANLGGAVSLPNVGADSIIGNCTFKDNTAADGGAVYFWTNGAGVKVTDSDFINNTAAYGGAIENEGIGDLTVDNCVFTENTASARGGAIISSGSTSVSDSVFTDNEALGNTNAIYLYNPGTTLELSNNTIAGHNKVQIFVKAGIDIVNPLNATFLGNKTVPAELNSIFILNATLTDGNGNFIYDADFRFSVDGEAIDEILFDGETGLYTVEYSIETAGQKVISTNYELDGLVKYTGILDVPKVNVTEFTVEVLPNIRFGENVTLNVTLLGVNGEKLNETFNVIVNNTEYAVTVTNGTGSFNVSGLAPGHYSALGIFPGNINYNGAYATALFTVLYPCPILNVTAEDITYGEEAVINITLTEADGTPLDGRIGINVGGIFSMDTTIIGFASISVSNLPTNESGWAITVYYLGDEDHLNAENDTETVKVLKADVSIVCETVTPEIRYGENATINVNISPNFATGNVTVLVDDAECGTFALDENANVTLTLSGLAVGNHSITLTYNGDDNYNARTGVVPNAITVGKALSKVTIEPVNNVTYGNDVSIGFTVLNATTVRINVATEDLQPVYNVTIAVNQSEYADSLVLSNVLPGKYIVVVYNEDDDKYEFSSTSANFTVDKAKSSVEIKPIENVNYGNDVSIGFNVLNATTIHINVATGDLQSVYHVAIDANTSEYENILTLSNLGAGKYIVVVENDGNDNYTFSSTSAEFTVNKAQPTMQTDISPDIKVGDANVVVQVVLPEDATGKVMLLIDGEPVNQMGYDLINGTVNITVPADIVTAGKHSYYVSYDGDDNYTSAYDFQSFEVSKVDPMVVIAVIQDEVTKEPAAVSIFVGNVTGGLTVARATGQILIEGYGVARLVPLEEGIYTLELIDIVPGDYEITVTYLGDDKFNNASNSTKFTVPKRAATVEITDVTANILYGQNATFTVNMNPDSANGNVTIYINGAEYATVVLDDEYANATVSIPGLGVGTYIIGVKYNGNDHYNASDIVNVSVTVGKADSEVTVLSAGNVTYGEDVTILYDVVNKTTLNVAVYKVDAGKIDADIVIGDDLITVKELTPGDYQIIIENLEDASYNYSFNGALFTVNKADSKVTIDPIVNVTYDDDVIVYFNVENETQISVLIFNETDFIESFDLNDGNVVIHNLIPGEYTIEISNGESEYYLPSKVAASFNVGKTIPSFNIGITDDIKVGDEGVNITVELPKDATGLVSVTVDGKQVAIGGKPINGALNITVPSELLTAGDHVYNVEFAGDERYTEISGYARFTVSKIDPTVTITVQNDQIGVMGSPEVSISVANDATGELVIDNNGIIRFVELAGGSYTFTITDLQAGDYYINVTYLGNDKYNRANATYEFTVEKADVQEIVFEAVTPEITYGDNATIKVSIYPDMANGNVTVWVDDVEYGTFVLDDEYANATITISGLTAGVHNITVTYNGNDNYNAKTGVAPNAITVGKATSEMSISIGEVAVDQDLEVTVNLPGVTGEVIIAIDGNQDTVYLNEGIGTYIIPKSSITAGNHTVEARFIGDAQYEAADAKVNFTVEKQEEYPFDVNLTIDEIDYGKDVSFNVTLPEDANGKVDVYVGDQLIDTVDVVNGTATVTVPADKLAAGENAVKLTYSDDKYGEKSVEQTITVDKLASELSASAENITVGNVATINISLPTYSNGTVTVTLDKEYNVTIENGQGKVEISDLAAGTYSAVVVFKDDGQYEDNFTIATFSVNKEAVPEDAINITEPTIATGEVITVNLPEDATGNVSVIVNGQEIANVPVENGTATIPVGSLPIGSNVVEVKYSGDDKYDEISVTKVIAKEKIDTVITVARAITQPANDYHAGERGEPIFILLQDTNGNPLANKTIQIAINGPIYNLTTDENGIVRAPIGLSDANVYTYAVSFKGDETYNAAPLASCKLTLTFKTTSISASAKTFKAKAKTKTVTATLKVSKNKYDGKTYLSAGKKITLKIKGKTYTAKANAKGVVKFNIKLTKKGKYTATIKFAGDKTYKGSSKSIKITIK